MLFAGMDAPPHSHGQDIRIETGRSMKDLESAMQAARIEAHLSCSALESAGISKQR